MDSPKPVLEYSSPARGASGGLASIWIAVAVAVWCAVVMKWDDPFRSMGNEKAVRIATAAGALGILVAIRDMSRARAAGIESNGFAALGLILNVLAVLASWTFLPCL
jgi:hypothetical protein